MRSILVIKCFQAILSISTLQNKHSLLFGCVTHLGIVIGKMLGMERLFYIKEKQGMQTSQIRLLERSPLLWGERLVQHSGILKVRAGSLFLGEYLTAEAGIALGAMRWL